MSENDKSVAIAMVGCGYWGKNLVRNFHAIDGLVAVCDPNSDVAKSMSEQYAVPALSWDEILSDDTINAVAIATPAETHAKLATQALNAGKHVYVEKPLALSISDAEAVNALAKEKGLTLMVGHLLQYHPAFMRLKAMVKAGEVGKLQYIYSTRLSFGKFRSEEDILWSFAPHDISMILSLTGSEPESVYANGSKFINDKIADTTITHLEFSGGISAHIFVSWLHPYKEQKLVVIGDKGMIVFDDTKPWEEKLAQYSHGINWVNGEPEPDKAEPVYVDVKQEEPLKNECLHFVNCVVSGEVPRTNGDEGIRVLRVLHSATQSLSSDSKGEANG